MYSTVWCVYATKSEYWKSKEWRQAVSRCRCAWYVGVLGMFGMFGIFLVVGLEEER